MRQLGKKRRSIGIRGQMMWFLCLICLLLLGLFWFLSTRLLEPLYTTHIQKQLTEQAEAIAAIAKPQGGAPRVPEAGIKQKPGRPSKKEILGIEDKKERMAAIAANIDLFK